MRGRDAAVPGWRVMGCSCGGDASGDFGFDFMFIAVSPRLDFVSRVHCRRRRYHGGTGRRFVRRRAARARDIRAGYQGACPVFFPPVPDLAPSTAPSISRSVVRIGTSESKILPPPRPSAGVSREDRAALCDRRGVRRAVQEHWPGQHLVARVGRGRGRASDPRLARWVRARDNLGSHVNVEARPAGTMRRAAGPHRD